MQKEVPTIQGELEKAIWKIAGEAVRVQGAGRTDAGVHARGQVASFDTTLMLAPPTFVKALNSCLPPDIAIRDACEVDADFNPRRAALNREYCYTVQNSSVESPLSRRWAYWVRRELDVDAMSKACDCLVGRHDFAPFTDKEGGAKNTVRTVLKAEVRKKSEFVFIEMVANSFLPHQVRRTAGSLVQVGLGTMEVESFFEIANSGKVGLAKTCAPSHGLCLRKVNYSDIGFGEHENV